VVLVKELKGRYPILRAACVSYSLCVIQSYLGFEFVVEKAQSMFSPDLSAGNLAALNCQSVTI